MSTFLTSEQSRLAKEIADMLTSRGERIAVAESTTGGLVSAALLSVAGASKYYAGGAVVYTLASRTLLAGADPAEYENYRGTTTDMLMHLAESMRDRLDAAWCVAESGLAGPGTGRVNSGVGRTSIAVVGPVSRVEVIETGIEDRSANMGEFTTRTLFFLRDAIAEA